MIHDFSKDPVVQQVIGYLYSKQTLQQLTNQPSDINEHLPILYEYAKKCSHITEMGVRSVVSSWSFVTGLCENGQEKKRLVGVDLEWHENINTLKNVCQQIGLDYSFVQGDSAKVEIEETDMLFIDTWHIYGHLRRELEAHHKKARKYIAFHDVEVDGIYGESIRMRHDVEEMMKMSGYPREEIVMGLMPAIEQFLQMHPEWSVVVHRRNNNGLMILERTA
jgi:hypothetical protein